MSKEVVDIGLAILTVGLCFIAVGLLLAVLCRKFKWHQET
jgi:hypothetical protein